MSEARITNVAIQVEVEEEKQVKVTNVAVNAEIQDEKQVKVTNVATQVELIDDNVQITNIATMIEYEGEEQVRITNAATMIEYEGEEAIRITNASLMVEYDYHVYLLVQDAVQIQTAENITFEMPGILSVENSTHTQTANNISLSLFYSLTIDDATHIQTVSNTNIAQNYLLSVQNSIHAQTSDNVIVTYNSGVVELSVNNCNHLQLTREVIAITGAVDYLLSDMYFGIYGIPSLYFPTIAERDLTHLVLIFHPAGVTNNTIHIVTSGSITLGYIPPVLLTVSNSTHIQTANNVDLFSAFFARLEVQGTIHHVISNKIDLIAYNPGLLQVQNSTHTQISENILLGLLEVNSSVHGQITTGDLILIQYRMAQDSVHQQTADNVDLIQHYALSSVQNSAHTQTSTTIIFTIIIIENLFGWRKIPIGIGINGPGIR